MSAINPWLRISINTTAYFAPKEEFPNKLKTLI